MDKDNITELGGGLHQDNSLINQPKKTYRFALNSVNETELGDFAFLSNEESNELCAQLKPSFVPIGKVYINSNEVIVFSVSEDETTSEIGIINDNCEYIEVVNDATSSADNKLNFKVTHQIQATYRLRRGCERTIYFTDDYNKPRYFNLDKPENFKEAGQWSSRKFNLFKGYSRIPEFEKVEVLESGGQLKPGSYNIAIQYVDEGLNATEWITTSPTINIYNSSLEDVYRDIRGSLPPNAEFSYLNFPETSKSIYIEFKNTSLDDSFIYYRLAFIEAVSGSGIITNVKYSDVIPTSKNYFIYTGVNVVEEGTKEDLVFFSEKIERVQSIEQIENRLILGNTQGKQVNFCNLQKFASRIKADCITKQVDLTNVHPISSTNLDANPKNPTANFEGLGYMPGEVYSFGIVYVFEDGSTTPVYHIPGKSNTLTDTTVFAPGDDVYPMSISNSSQSTYVDNETCQNSGYGYWGLDSEGNVLLNQPVRHHRFPMRKDIGLDLVRNAGASNSTTVETVSLQVSLELDILLPMPEDTSVTPSIPPIIKNPFHVKVLYTVNGAATGEVVLNVNPSFFQTGVDTHVLVKLYGSSPAYDQGSIFQVTRITIIVPQEIIDAELLLPTPNLIDSQYLEFGYYMSTYNDYSTTNSSNFYFEPSNQPTVPSTPINTFPAGAGTSFINTLTGTVEPGIIVGTYVQTLDSKQFETDILGIKFTGIDLPPLSETNGEKIIGYYIVRNERVDTEKTILDSAVLVPTLRNNKYIATGLLSPDFSIGNATQEKTTWAVIHPEHKFRDNKIFNFDEIIQEGNFDKDKILYGKITQNDVSNGSSYDSDAHKDGNDDGSDGYGNEAQHGVKDGFSIDILSRDFITDYKTVNNGFTITKSQVEKQFYLDALASETLEYATGNEYLGKRFWDVYNIAADNRIGILKLDNLETALHTNVSQYNLPYVVYKRNILDNYSTFRQSTYYKVHTNIELFGSNTTSNVEVFGGDSMVHPMRYVNTVFWDTRVAKRAGRTNAWNIVLAAVLFVAAVVIAIFSWGTGVAASAALIGTGAALIAAGGAALFASAAVKEAAYRKAYSEEYAKGLRETALDKWVRYFYQYPNYNTNLDNSFGIPVYTSEWNDGVDGPSDDTVQWIGDCITDLWFETSVNISLRNGFTSNLATHLNAPGFIESGNTSQMVCREYFRKKGGARWVMSYTRYPVSKLEQHLHKKLLVNNQDRYEGYEYMGLPTGEYYNVNPDYHRTDKEKPFYHLPLEYDCCTDCQEDFPHRVHYSEQSFQEELTDNYRTFLPNNYRDIEGETGEIKNIFKINNDLFIHTLEGLWQMPRSYQERVTDQIVSFIGTGSFFEIPPQKIIDDDNGSSAGTQHKWSSIKTPNGYFFVSENQRRIYQFDGKQLKPISNIGLSNWFKEHIRLAINQQYYNTTGNIYTYNDNPSNLFGSGFISTYDTKKERILFTKKDFLFSPDVVDTPDYEICINNGQVILFPNYNTIISTEEAAGWNYLGLENCRMKFSRDVLKTRTEIREITTVVNVSNKADIHVFYDTSGSFDGQGLQDIRNAVADWVANFAATNTSWTGNLYEYNNSRERWVNFLEVAIGTTYSGVDLSTKDVILVTFVNESTPGYHGGGLENPINGFTGTFQTDYNTFVSRINTTSTPSTTKLNSFIGVNYPIAFSSGGYSSMSKCYVEHCLAGIQGAIFTAIEAAAIPVNPGFTSGEWGTMLAALQGSNPYSTLGTPLRDYGWRIIPNRYWDGSNTVLTSQQFQDDITALLAGFTQTIIEEVETDVTYVETEYQYIDGTVVEDPIELNNSWTMSYSLKQGTWTSWHSYLPNFYINVPEKFYSWRYGDNNIWKHNRLANYQTYYGVYKPHIIEYVSLSTPLITRIWNHLKLVTEAKVYNSDYEQYVEDRFTTFNKAIFYNSRQCSGELNLKVKDTDYNQQDWFSNQTINENNNDIVIERRERDWNINDLRDIRTNYNLPIWNSKLSSVQSEYFIDKILNTSSLNVNKDWTQLESFRDKYLVVRLIFDKFATSSNIKLITNYSTENEQQSFS